jgi:hypothetical protein
MGAARRADDSDDEDGEDAAARGGRAAPHELSSSVVVDAGQMLKDRGRPRRRQEGCERV